MCLTTIKLVRERRIVYRAAARCPKENSIVQERRGMLKLVRSPGLASQAPEIAAFASARECDKDSRVLAELARRT